jgi:hypothetical protein
MYQKQHLRYIGASATTAPEGRVTVNSDWRLFSQLGLAVASSHKPVLFRDKDERELMQVLE